MPNTTAPETSPLQPALKTVKICGKEYHIESHCTASQMVEIWKAHSDAYETLIKTLLCEDLRHFSGALLLGICERDGYNLAPKETPEEMQAIQERVKRYMQMKKRIDRRSKKGLKDG